MISGPPESPEATYFGSAAVQFKTIVMGVGATSAAGMFTSILLPSRLTSEP
jgi:hypothetical protein